MKQKLMTFFDRQNLISTAWDYTLVTIGTLLIALGFNLFVRSTNIAPGGIMGLTLIINHFTGWSMGLVTLMLQIPMLVLGFYYLGRFHFLVSAWYVTLLYGFSLDIMYFYLPPEGLTDDFLLNALYGGVIAGVGSGLVYLGRSAFTGTGIIARVIQLKTGIPITQLYMMVDGAVIIFQGLLFGWEIALYAMLMLFIWGLATDYTLEGPSVIRTAFIITTRPEEISDALFERLGVGITGWGSEGMFTKAEKTTLFCTVYRPDINVLREIVAQVDPNAFVVIGQGHQARGGVLRPKRQVNNTPKLQKLIPKPSK